MPKIYKRLKCLLLRILIIFLFCMLVFIPIAAASENDRTNVYPLPIAELATIFSDWLTQSGYTVHSSQTNMGRVRLEAVQGRETWQIDLVPHSALATETQTQYTGTEPGPPDMPGQIASHVKAYLKSDSAKGDGVKQSIPATVVDQLRSVVCIKASFEDENTQFSGFLVDAQGLIISTTHSLKNLQKIRVTHYDGRQYTGDLIKIDHEKDLALVKIDLNQKTFVSLTTGRPTLKMGEKVFTIGCPYELIGTIYSGVVNGLPRKVNRMPYWQVNMEIHPGSSGSPVFDVGGNLVGIVKGRYRGTETIGFLIPVETIIDFITDE
jgi:serine protease Do